MQCGEPKREYLASRQNGRVASTLPTVTRIGVNEECGRFVCDTIMSLQYYNPPNSTMSYNNVGTVNYCGWWVSINWAVAILSSMYQFWSPASRAVIWQALKWSGEKRHPHLASATKQLSVSTVIYGIQWTSQWLGEGHANIIEGFAEKEQIDGGWVFVTHSFVTRYCGYENSGYGVNETTFTEYTRPVT